MNKLINLLLMLFICVISGCAIAPQSSPPPITRPKAEVSQAVWDVAYQGEDFRSNSKATGVILFSAQSNRKNLICEALIQNMPSIDSVSSALDLRVTYWLSTSFRGKSSPSQLTCDFLLQTYDYQRAQRILTEINANKPEGSQKLTGEGPIFVGFSGKDNGVMVVIDGSTRTDDEMKSLVQQWMGTIVQDPELWNKANQVSQSQAGTIEAKEPSSASNKFWQELWEILKPILTVAVQIGVWLLTGKPPIAVV